MMFNLQLQHGVVMLSCHSTYAYRVRYEKMLKFYKSATSFLHTVAVGISSVCMMNQDMYSNQPTPRYLLISTIDRSTLGISSFVYSEALLYCMKWYG